MPTLYGRSIRCESRSVKQEVLPLHSSCLGSDGLEDGSERSGALPSLVVHHMDHLLLGDKAWWSCLKPDVVLQIGAHGTSKRLAQFLVS